MDFDSPLFDRIRVRKRGEEPRPAAGPLCESPGCRALGDHRAPKGRGDEGRYWRFCLEHVRAYNQTYNYFAGMPDDAVAAYQKDAATGHRPTWSMGVKSAGKKPRGPAPVMDDPFDVTGVAGTMRNPRAEPERPRWKIHERKALELLDLPETASAGDIKARYKLLVKRLHPDANGGDRSSETRLQDVIQAYKTLSNAEAASA